MDAPLLLHYNRLFRKREVVLYAIVLRIWSMLDKGTKFSPLLQRNDQIFIPIICNGYCERLLAYYI